MSEDERMERENRAVAWSSLLMVAAMILAGLSGLAVILSGAARLIYMMWA